MIFSFVLLLFRIGIHLKPELVLNWIDSFYVNSFLDLILVASVYFLFREVHFLKSYRSYLSFKELGHVRFLFQFNFGLFTDFLRIISLFFVFSWLIRWLNINFDPDNFSTSDLYLSYLDSYLFCCLLILVLKPERAGRFLHRINLTNHRMILLQFLAAIVIGSVFLQLPFMLNPGQHLSVIDALFVSVSALSVTGLSPVDISIVLNFWGQLVLLILIQLGGLGVIILTLGLTSALRKNLSLNHFKLSQASFDGCYIGNATDYLKNVVYLTLAFETLGAILLYFSLPANDSYRLFSAVFHSISAFCNAGFSLYSSNLQDPVFNNLGLSTICILIILGGLGFPVLIEILNAFKEKQKVLTHLSPQSKFVIGLTILFLVAGAILFYFLIHMNSSYDNTTSFQKFMLSVFYSVSSRTAGFNLLPLENFGLASQFIVIILMFIGASPSSTGGGVKTTTVGVLFAAILSNIKNKNQVTVFSRAVSDQILLRSISVIGLYISFASIAILILTKTEKVDFFSLIFEVVSALSTVGLSLSVTPQLTTFGKLIVILLMLFGRIGLITLITASTGEIKKSKIMYPQSDFFVG